MYTSHTFSHIAHWPPWKVVHWYLPATRGLSSNALHCSSLKSRDPGGHPWLGRTRGVWTLWATNTRTRTQACLYLLRSYFSPALSTVSTSFVQSHPADRLLNKGHTQSLVCENTEDNFKTSLISEPNSIHICKFGWYHNPYKIYSISPLNCSFYTRFNHPQQRNSIMHRFTHALWIGIIINELF